MTVTADKLVSVIAMYILLFVTNLLLTSLTVIADPNTSSVSNTSLKTKYQERKMFEHFFENKSADFQGIDIKSQETVFIERKPIVETEGDYYYAGNLIVRGMIRVFVPSGKSDEIWDRHERRIRFQVINKETGQPFKTSYIQGGHAMFRASPSLTVSFASEPTPAPDLNGEFIVKDNQIVEKYFNIDLFDRLHDVPLPGEIIEFYVEFDGLKSNKLVVEFLEKK